jgi:hypothetical protein
MGHRFITQEPFHGRTHCELSVKAIFKGCDVDEIPIPPIINIRRHLEPHLPGLQETWKIWLAIDVERRALIFRSQEKANRVEADNMVSDRHRQEFRYIFLAYVQECLETGKSSNFIDFHNEDYRDETDTWRNMAEKLAVEIKQHYIDKGKWR